MNKKETIKYQKKMTQEEIDKIDKCIQSIYSKKEINKEDKIVLTSSQHYEYMTKKAKVGDIAVLAALARCAIISTEDNTTEISSRIEKKIDKEKEMAIKAGNLGIYVHGVTDRHCSDSEYYDKGRIETLEQINKVLVEKAKNGDIAAIEILCKYSTLYNAK